MSFHRSSKLGSLHKLQAYNYYRQSLHKLQAYNYYSYTEMQITGLLEYLNHKIKEGTIKDNFR